MIIDDEQNARDYLKKLLLQIDDKFEIVDFESPFEAISYARNHDIDVAFLDIEMPGYKGIDVAQKLCEMKHRINIIFSTGYEEYALDAFGLFASGYLLKPVIKSELLLVLDNLRYPVSSRNDEAMISNEKENNVYIRCFGNFDIFVDNKPVCFSHSKAKEVLACLIDRQGGTMSRKELAAIIFEDKEYTRTTQSYLTLVIKQLSEELKNINLEKILVKENNNYCVDMSMLSCDITDSNQDYHGEYMEQYSWAEYSKERYLWK